MRMRSTLAGSLEARGISGACSKKMLRSRTLKVMKCALAIVAAASSVTLIWKATSSYCTDPFV